VYDPTDPIGKMFFNILATFAEFEVDLLRMRTCEGMAIARANGRLRGKAPKLSARQRVHVLGLAQAGEHTIAELAELFSLSRATIYPRDRPSPTRPNLTRPRRPHNGCPSRLRPPEETPPSSVHPDAEECPLDHPFCEPG